MPKINRNKGINPKATFMLFVRYKKNKILEIKEIAIETSFFLSNKLVPKSIPQKGSAKDRNNLKSVGIVLG